MWEAEAAGGKVTKILLVNEDDIIDAETFEEKLDANREDADKERDEDRRKLESGEVRSATRITSGGGCSCWRREKFLDKFPAGCLHGPSKHDLIRILSDWEFGPTTEKGCTVDASSIINAVQDADESPRDEDAEMDRWRMMHEGMEFWHDVTDWKPLNWELAVQAESFRLNCSRRWVCKRKYLETLPRIWVARS